MRQKGFAPTLIIFGVVIILGVIAVIYSIASNQTNKQTQPSTITPTVTQTLIPSPYPSPVILSLISPTPISSSEMSNFKRFTTKDNFGLTQEILDEYPTIAKGNLSFKYPANWKLVKREPGFTNHKLYGVFLGFVLNKEHPNYSSPGELPAEYSAYIDFKIKATDKSPYDLVQNYEREFGRGAPDEKIIIYENFNGYKAAEAIGPHDNEVLTDRRIVFSVSPTTALAIDVEFYDFGNEKEYAKQTEKEINQILSTITITP